MTDFLTLGGPTRTEIGILSQGGQIDGLSPTLIHRERATINLPGLLERADKEHDTEMMLAVGIASVIACNSDVAPTETIDDYRRVTDATFDLLEEHLVSPI